MNTTTTEIAPDIFRLSTLVAEAAPGGFSFNQFLVRDEQPFLFHTGMRQLYPLVSAAVARLIDLADLRWISFAHVEADECGAMNLFLADAPRATSSTARSRAWSRSTTWPTDRRGRSPRTRCSTSASPPALPPDAARAAQLGERAVVRRDDRNAVRRRPVHPLGDVPAIVEDDLVEAALVAESMFGATS